MYISEEITTIHGDIKLCLLSLHGTLELSTVLSLKTRLSRLLSEGEQRIIIDLGQVTFIDSSGITTLVVSTRQAKSQQGSILITNLSPKIAYTFEITMMEEVLEIYPSREEAIQSFLPGDMD